jgi:hypothetical protein
MKSYFIGILVILAGIFVLGVFQASITGNLVKEDKIVLYFPMKQDFGNVNEGTVSLNINLPGSEFKVGDKQAELLIFVDSTIINGLQVGYDIRKKTLYGGLPLIESGEVNINDGNHHQLVYTYHKALGKQQLLLDGTIIAEGDYSGEQGNSITGLVVFDDYTKIEAPFEIEVEFS